MKIFAPVKSKTSRFERIIFAVLLIIFSLSFYYKPISYYQIETGIFTLPDFSIFHNFELHGPTCGLTRSFVNISHGRLIDGFLANFMGPFVYVSFLLCFIYLGYRFFGGNTKLTLALSAKHKRLLLFLIIFAFLFSWILKFSLPLKTGTS